MSGIEVVKRVKSGPRGHPQKNNIVVFFVYLEKKERYGDGMLHKCNIGGVLHVAQVWASELVESRKSSFLKMT